MLSGVPRDAVVVCVALGGGCGCPVFGTPPGVVVPKTPHGAAWLTLLVAIFPVGVLGPVDVDMELVATGVYMLTIGTNDALHMDDLPFTLDAFVVVGLTVLGVAIVAPVVFTG